MLTWLFLRKANFNRIRKILEKEDFLYTEEDINNLLQGNQKGTRYGNVVLAREEGDKQEKRFLKIVLDGTWRTYKLFRRQVEVTKSLAQDSQYNFPKLTVLSSSLKPPVPYSVFETRENGEDYGFMHDRPEYYEKFTESDVLNLAKVIYGFHLSGLSISEKVLNHTQEISSRPNIYKKEINEHLNKKIFHKSMEGKESEQLVERLLEQYTQVSGLRMKIFEMWDINWKFVESSKDNKSYLVHADMALDNVYKHKDGKLEPLDFEWVGHTDNPIIPIMYDYGNLRARAWSSPQFQSLLDKAMLEEGKRQYGNENMIKAGLTLGVLRSGLMMCRYHMDFKNTVKKDRCTEEDYFSMFPKTVDTIKNLLNNS